MPRTKLFLLSLTLCVAALLVAGVALAAGTSPATGLKKVEAKKVCMVNDQASDKDMIPVQVGDKTYGVEDNKGPRYTQEQVEAMMKSAKALAAKPA